MISDGDGTYSFQDNTIANHKDVDIVNLSIGNILAWNPFALAGSGAWVPAVNPAELISVSVAAPGTPNLSYNTSSKVMTYTPPNFAGLDDTNISGVSVGEHLQWDGTDWVNVANPVAGLSVVTNAAGAPALSVDATGTFSYTPPNFQGLGDVDTGTSATTANMRMVSDGDGTYSFVNDTLENLSDTNFSLLSADNFLRYDGSVWRNVMINQLSDMTVTTNAPGSPALSFLGTTLTYTPPNFEGLSDVDTSTSSTTANMRLRSDGDGTYSFVQDTLGSLTDVIYGGPLTFADTLMWTGSNWTRTQIYQLTQLTVTTAAAGTPSLSFNGTTTLTYTPPNLAGLDDTNFTSLTAGEHLQWDGTDWVNVNVTPTVTNDVTIGEVLKYDTGTSTWTAEDLYGASSQRIQRTVSGSDIIYTFL
jgi:hypothetical protein